MKIIEIQEKTVPISSEIQNAYIDFKKMDCSVVAIKTDVKKDGKFITGYGFHSNGRYAVSELLTKRFIPRLKEAKEEILDTLADEINEETKQSIMPGEYKLYYGQNVNEKSCHSFRRYFNNLMRCLIKCLSLWCLMVR